MRRGIVWIGHETLASLLRLRDGEYVHAVDTDWPRMAVGVCVAGPDLPDVAEGAYPPGLDVGEYVDLHLRAKLVALVERWGVGPELREPGGGKADDVLAVLSDVLSGTFDPRIEMHGPDVS